MFEGTGISIEMSGEMNEEFRVVIDSVAGLNVKNFPAQKTVHVLAEGLEEGIHTMEIMKETFNGKSFFYGLSVTGTGIMTLPDRPALRIEFFGDSNMNGSSLYSEKKKSKVSFYYRALRNDRLDIQK